MSHVIDWQARAAAIDIKQSFCVVAPAGSGKTELLTQRLLALLGHVNAPEEILAITFTRKAAAEMQDRVIAAMQKAQLPAQEGLAEHELLTRRLATAVLERDKQLNWQLIQSPGRLRLRTIDGFCASVTQQLPMTAKLGAQMGVTDNAEPLYQQAIRDLLQEGLAKPECEPHLATILALLENKLENFEKLFVQLLQRRDQWLPWVVNARQANKRDELYQQLIEDIELYNRLRLDALIEHLAPVASDLALLLDFAGQHAPAGNAEMARLKGLRSLPSSDPHDFGLWQTIFSMLLTQQGDFRKNLNAAQGFPAPSSEKNKVLKALFTERKQLMQEVLGQIQLNQDAVEAIHHARILVPAVMPDQDYQILSSLLHLMPIATAYLEYTFAKEGAVDYIEINRAANAALGDDDNPTELALKLDYQIKHILLDEFQDTSFPQLALLQKLTAGWQVGDGRSLFIVGDGMQSCYGFRDANVGIFLNARNQGVGLVKLNNLQLEVNFRSQQGIVHWVNETFARAFPTRDDAQLGAVKFALASAIKPCLDNAAVQCHAFSGDNARNEEAQQVVRLIQQAQQQTPEDSIAVLVRGRGHLRQLLPELQNAGIDWIAEEIDPLNTRGFINDIINLYCAVNFPADTQAWLSILRSPLFGLSLVELHILQTSEHDYPAMMIERSFTELALSATTISKLQRLADAVTAYWQQRQRKPLAEALRHLWLDLRGRDVILKERLPHTAERDIDNFLNHLQKLALHSTFTLPSREDIQTAIDKLYASVDTSQAKAIHVMTIHKSKGLEFDTVIIPGLDRVTPANDKELVMWQPVAFPDNREGLLLAPLNDSGQSERLYDLLRTEKQRRERLESIRLLYVGATRAIKHLHLTGCLKTDENGDVKAPSAGALLHGIWQTFAEQMIHKAGLDDAQRIQISQQNLRLIDVDLPPQQIIWQPGVGATNLPDNDNVSYAQNLGVLFHLVCEFLAGNINAWRAANPQQHSALIAQFARRLKLDVASADLVSDCLMLINKSVNSDDGQWVLGWHPTQQNEWQIIDDDGQMYVIDRFFIDADGQAFVIDYKTSSPSHDEDEQSFMQQEMGQYGHQLTRYKQLLERMGLYARCGLFFPSIGCFCEMQ